MELYSTSDKSQRYSLREALLLGLAHDGGLLMPVDIPSLPESFLSRLPDLSFAETSYHVAHTLIGDSIPSMELQDIIDQSITFPAPLIHLTPSQGVLELFHGPSLAFKDFGAQFMARTLSYFNRNENDHLTILVATSGDTGGAVAAGFHNVPGINVVILYPKGKVSKLQELQLTSFGSNISALSVIGTFDDCQALVKQAFNDVALRKAKRLTSANSINIGRLIPQSFYYFEGFKQAISQDRPIRFVVPSGNFGNLTAGLIAKRMGLDIASFLAATNINDIVPKYLESGNYSPRRSQETLSNAMDVGNPSNFDRILDLYGSTWNRITVDIVGSSSTDHETTDAIQTVFQKYNYIIDPHAAVGYLASQKKKSEFFDIILGTAHPSKFKSTIDEALGFETPLHPSLEQLLHRASVKTEIENSYNRLRSYLLD